MTVNPTLPQQFGRAVSAGDIESVKTLAQRHPELLTKDRLNYNLRDAANRNAVEMMSLLVDLGAEVDAPIGDGNSDPEGCINSAANSGAIDAVRWLLKKGAKVNYEVNGAVRCFPLRGAILFGHDELARVLVENGADVNAMWNGQNALSLASSKGMKELEAYLRSKGATYFDDPSKPPTERRAGRSEGLILDHITRHLGAPAPLSLQEIVRSTPSIKIHLIELSDAKVLVTTGMSSLPMKVPAGRERYQFAELLIYLPNSWPLDEASLTGVKFSWPVEWLRKISLYPHQNSTWLGGKTTIISNGSPPKPLAPNTTLSCILAMTEDSDFGYLDCGDGSQVVFYTLFPLYMEERELETREGISKLLTLFEENGIGCVVDISRINVAK